MTALLHLEGRHGRINTQRTAHRFYFPAAPIYAVEATPAHSQVGRLVWYPESA